jgi:hypothetical protein
MDIIVIAFTATLCGSDEFEEMSAIANFTNKVGDCRGVWPAQGGIYQKISGIAERDTG